MKIEREYRIKPTFLEFTKDYLGFKKGEKVCHCTLLVSSGRMDGRPEHSIDGSGNNWNEFWIHLQNGRMVSQDTAEALSILTKMLRGNNGVVCPFAKKVSKYDFGYKEWDELDKLLTVRTKLDPSDYLNEKV
jgi:hypothetical protein